MSGHDALTLALSVGFSVVFVILSAMVVHAIRSLSKAAPVMANQAPAAPAHRATSRAISPAGPAQEGPRRGRTAAGGRDRHLRG